jgi:hypothetical protein
MKTAREYAHQMANEGIISFANIDETERFFFRYMEGFRIQLINDIHKNKKEMEEALKWTISELEALNEAHGQDEGINVQLQEAKKCLRQ